MKPYCLCIDVGGSSIKYALIDETRILHKKGSIPTPLDSLEHYIQCLCDIYEQFQQEVYGIALSVPGIIDHVQGICITGGHLKYIDNFPIVEVLKQRCHVPVCVMNDAKSAALAESQWGALSNCRDGIVLVFGTGIGGAIVKDSSIHGGAHFAAGEFSWFTPHTEFDGEEHQWFALNGVPKLIQMVANAKGVDKNEISGECIFEWAENGDVVVLQILDKFTRTIASMILNLQVIYDPEQFAIGGGISKQPLFLEYVKKNIAFYMQLTKFLIPEVNVVPCQFYNDANLLGAYAHFLNMN